MVGSLIAGVVIVFAVFFAEFQTTALGQTYCNSRDTVTLPTAGCGSTSVCSPLMAAVTQTRNWWNGTNNTAGNSLGVAATSFFTTTTYNPLLTITNTNGTSGQYSTACKKIAAIVAQLNAWANKTQANWTLANATYGATAKQELYGTVIPTWHHTIGEYIACGGSCGNFTSTTSSTTTTTKAPTTTTTARPTTTTTTHSVCTGTPVNTSGVLYLKLSVYDEDYSLYEPLSGSCACSSPYAQQLYLPGLNTPQSALGPTRGYSLQARCYPLDHNGADVLPASMCFCSPNGSCYIMVTESNDFIDSHITPWCGADGICHSYLTKCATGLKKTFIFRDAVTSQVAYNCTAINDANSSAIESCPGPACPFPILDYLLCDNCSAGGLKPQIDCPTFSRACENGPIPDVTCNFLINEPLTGSGENFPTFSPHANGSCGGCTVPTETEYYFDTTINITCWNGANSSQRDWSGMCVCTLDGNCYHFVVLPGTNTTLNEAVSFVQLSPNANHGSCENEFDIYCAEVDPNVQLVDVHGNVVGTCDRASDRFDAFHIYAAYSFRCNGGCPSDKPLDQFCPGPYVPAL